MDCGEEMAVGSMSVHQKTQNGREAGGRRKWETPTPEVYPHTYRTDFPTAGGLRELSVERCMGPAATRTAMKVQLLQRHAQDTLIIMGKGNLSHPR